MATFILLSNLTAEGWQTLADRPQRINEVNAEIGDFGCSVVSQFVTLGTYDFVTIIEAPDTETVARLSVNLASRGTMTMTTMPAIPRAEFIESMAAAKDPSE